VASPVGYVAEGIAEPVSTVDIPIADEHGESMQLWNKQID
jgi:hypothetical protein